MRYVSPSGRLVGPEAAFNTGMSRRELLWDRARESVAGGRFWTALLVLLLTVTVARSTSTVHWVDGIDVIIYISRGSGNRSGWASAWSSRRWRRSSERGR